MSDLPSTENIRCSSCKRTYDFQDTGWRWAGATWEHKCPENDPQAGYFLAEQIPQDEAPPMSDPTQWGIHQLKRDLATMQDPDERLSNLFNAAEDRLIGALDELAILRAWRERAVGVLHALTDNEDRLIYDAAWCMYCRQHPWDEEHHLPDCPYLAARALLGEGGQE